MGKITDAQAQALVDQNTPLKRCENENFCFWFCDGLLDGYFYRSGRVPGTSLADDSTLDQAKAYFKAYFKTLDYLGVKPKRENEKPSE